METFGDIYTAFYPLIGDAIGSNRFISTTQAANFCKKAVRDLGVASGCVDFVYEYTWQANDSTYSIGGLTGGTEYISTWRVEVDDERIAPVTRNRLRYDDHDWQSRTGKPYLYYLDEMTSTGGKYTVGLYPTPTTNTSTRWYFRVTPDPSEAGTVTLANAAHVQLPKWAVPGVLYGMLADFYMIPGARRNINASRFYRGLYDGVKAQLKIESNGRLPKDRRVGGKRKPRLRQDEYRGDISTIS